MKEKVIIIIAAVAYIFLIAIGWNDTSIKQSFGGREILTFWHTYNDHEEIILRDIIKKWEALPENASYTVRPVRIPFEGHKEKIRTAVTVGQGPDMARVDWSFVCELARKNAAIDLDSLGFDKIADQYLAAPLKSCFVDGKYYGMPDQSNCVACFYNRKLFKQAGLIPVDSLEPDEDEYKRVIPQNWDALKTMAASLTVKNSNGTIDQYPIAINNTLWWNLVFFHTYGVKVISDDGKKCELNSPQAIECLTMMRSLVEKNIEGRGWKAGAITPEQGFVNDKYAMIFDGPWDLARFDNLESLDYGVGLVPAGPNGSSSNIGGTDIVIMRDKKDPKAVTAKMQKCFEFFKFFTNADNQVTWCEELNQIPINLGAYDKVHFKNKKLGVFLEQMKVAGPNPVVKDFGLMEDIINPEVELALDGQSSPADALNRAARKIQEQILDL